MYEVLHYIDGKIIPGAAARSQDIVDPARGEMIGCVRLAAREDVEAAVAAAADRVSLGGVRRGGVDLGIARQALAAVLGSTRCARWELEGRR